MMTTSYELDQTKKIILIKKFFGGVSAVGAKVDGGYTVADIVVLIGVLSR